MRMDDIGKPAAGDGADGGAEAREERRDHDHAPGLVKEAPMQVPGVGHPLPGVRPIAKAPDGDASGACLLGQPGCMGHDGLAFISEIALEMSYLDSSRGRGESWSWTSSENVTNPT